MSIMTDFEWDSLRQINEEPNPEKIISECQQLLDQFISNPITDNVLCKMQTVILGYIISKYPEVGFPRVTITLDRKLVNVDIQFPTIYNWRNNIIPSYKQSDNLSLEEKLKQVAYIARTLRGETLEPFPFMSRDW
jgi:hypothetical protein